MTLMRKTLLPLVGVLGIAAAGVASPAHADGATFLGTGMGAALGGFLGSQFGKGTGQLAATGAGVAVGGLVGNSIGRDIDRQSRYGGGTAVYSEPAPVIYNTYYAPNYVAPPSPPPTYVIEEAPPAVEPEMYCREFSQEIRIDGRLQESYGTACLQPDGSWRIMP